MRVQEDVDDFANVRTQEREWTTKHCHGIKQKTQNAEAIRVKGAEFVATASR